MDDLSKLSDPARLAAVRGSGLLESGQDPNFDQLARLAARLLGAPSAFVTVITDREQYIKSAIENGSPSDLAGVSQPLDMSFCKHAVARNEPLIVENAREHELVKTNKAVAAGVIAYAGIPLQTQDGEAVGALCVVDSKPRQWSAEDIDNLRALARSAMKLIDDQQQQAPRDARNSPSSILECVAIHLRALDAYAKLLQNSKAFDFGDEAELRNEVLTSFSDLKAAFEKRDGSGIEPELRDAIANYLHADAERSHAGRAFASGEIELPTLETAISQHMDAADQLRVTALNHGAEL